MPSTNAISERSLSALRRVKNYLSSSMTLERLNHLFLLNAHKQLTDSMDLIAVANDFVALSEHRWVYLGSSVKLTLYPLDFAVNAKHCWNAHHVTVKHIFNYTIGCFVFGLLHHSILYTCIGGGHSTVLNMLGDCTDWRKGWLTPVVLSRYVEHDWNYYTFCLYNAYNNVLMSTIISEW